ncbi:MAG TPA: hypothetical protein VF069_20240 [Streptosporangiaceae bacterium]
MTSIRRLGALTLAAPLAVGITAFTPVAAAQAAGSGIKSPADNAVITDGATTTVTAHLALLATGDLYVRGPGSADRKIAGGIGPRDISGSVSISRNGAYVATLKGLLGTIDQQTFYVRIPPARPAGVDAGVSARKLVVRWDRGNEPDLTGYDVFLGGTEVRHGTPGGLCAGEVCSTSLSLPGSGGHTSVGVRARRSTGTGGTVASGISTTSVVLPSPVTTSAVAPTPGALPSQSAQPLLPLTGKSPLSLPTVAPNGRQPGFQYPTPGPQVAEPVVGTNTSSESASSPLRWAKSVALALVLLVAAAHLGAWTRRLRLAQGAAMEPATATGKATPAKRGPQTGGTAGLARQRTHGAVPAVSGRLIDAKGSAVDAAALLGTSGTSDRSSPEPADEPPDDLSTVMAASATASTHEGKARARQPKVDNRSDPRRSGGYRGRRRAD